MNFELKLLNASSPPFHFTLSLFGSIKEDFHGYRYYAEANLRPVIINSLFIIIIDCYRGKGRCEITC
jgi:hypothetical protein